MTTPDGLSGVFRGVEGSGEAQIIGSGPGLQIADQILAKDRYEKEKRDKETADMAKLGSGSVTSKWSQTNFKELMPTLSQYRSEFGDVMRGIQTEKDPYKREILKQEYADKFNRLEELAKTDSMVYDEYQKYVDAYKKDPNKFDTEVEVNGRIYNVDEAQAVLANPYDVPELQEEIQKAGGVIPWRAQNWRKFVPETAYSINEDIKSQGIKLDQWIEDDLRKVGGEDLIITKTGLKPDRLESTYNSFWDRKSLKGERFRDQMDRNVSEGAQIVEDSAGNKLLIGSDPLMQESIDFLMSNKKKTETIEDVKARLPKEYGKRVFDKYHQGEEKQSRLPNYWQQANLKAMASGGGSGSVEGVGDIQSIVKVLPRRKGDLQINQDVSGVGFSFTPSTVDIQTPSILYDSETGEKITDPKVLKFEVGELQVVPVVTRDYMSDGLLIKAGSPIPNRILSDAKQVEALKKNNLIKYDVLAYGGSGKEDERKSYYTTLNNVEGRINMATKAQSVALQDRISKLKAERDRLNGEVSPSVSIAQQMRDAAKNKK